MTDAAYFVFCKAEVDVICQDYVVKQLTGSR